MTNTAKMIEQYFGTQNPGIPRDKAARTTDLERLLAQVAGGQGGTGDYTKEKYESPDEDLDVLCAELDAMAAARRRSTAD